MSEELSFVIYCVEEYKNEKKLSGKEVIRLFERYSVCEYIKSFHKVLCSNDFKYIIKDIDYYIESKKNKIVIEK